MKFGGRTFASKKEAKEYVRDLINRRIGQCESVKSFSRVLFEELLEILRQHYDTDTLLEGMVDLRIVRNKAGTGLEVQVIRADGEFVQISWIACIDGPPTIEQRLITALRDSTTEQILDFKSNSSAEKCEKCGRPMAFNEKGRQVNHVDHIIHFEKLVKDFLKLMTQKGIRLPNKFGKGNLTSRNAFLPEDKEFEDEWKTFHKENARLRILCPECNLRREKFKSENSRLDKLEKQRFSFGKQTKGKTYEEVFNENRGFFDWMKRTKPNSPDFKEPLEYYDLKIASESSYPKANILSPPVQLSPCAVQSPSNLGEFCKCGSPCRCVEDGASDYRPSNIQCLYCGKRKNQCQRCHGYRG